jgi:pimeloyl-ACP methyl ester carboxylesterase
MIPASIRALRPRSVLPPIWRELLLPVHALCGSDGPAAWQGDAGRRTPVLLIPGFLTGDHSLAQLRGFLTARGCPTYGAGMSLNVNCGEAAVTDLGERVARIADEHEGRVAIVGHSRGGLYGRAVAQRWPEHVSGVVTLASPHRDQLAVHPLLWASAMALAAAGSLGAPNVMRYTCAGGACCARFRSELTGPWPEGVGLLAIYSRRDGVVDWRACVDDDETRSVAVDVGHCGMAVHQPTFTLVADAVQRFGAEDEAAGPRTAAPCAARSRPQIDRRRADRPHGRGVLLPAPARR